MPKARKIKQEPDLLPPRIPRAKKIKCEESLNSVKVEKRETGENTPIKKLPAENMATPSISKSPFKDFKRPYPHECRFL